MNLSLSDWQVEVHNLAVAKGWWDEGTRNDGEVLALIHQEVSEALGWLREGNPPSDHTPEISGYEEEMADIVIRVMDIMKAKGFDLENAIRIKHEFNKGRPFRHGGKKF